MPCEIGGRDVVQLRLQVFRVDHLHTSTADRVTAIGHIYIHTYKRGKKVKNEDETKDVMNAKKTSKKKLK